MPEDSHVVSISSNPAIGPDDLLRKTFPVARRGLDPDAVRAFLSAVADEMRDQADRDAQLRRLLADAERRADNPEIDEAMLSRSIGAETAKILQSAHEAANDLVARAEARATELITEAERLYQEHTVGAEEAAAALRAATEAEATEALAGARAEAARLAEESAAQADALVAEAQQAADDHLEAAQDDAVALLDATTEECRRMVGEARDLRNRVLADLSDRRRAMHVQLEQLRTGKDSLIEVVETVGVTVDELRERLAGAEDEARLAATEAGHRAAVEADTEGPGPLEEELAAAVAEAVADEAFESAPSPEAADGEAAPARPTSKRSVDELFAKIRASRAAEEAEARGIADGGPSPDDDGAIEAEESLEDERLEAVAEVSAAVEELEEAEALEAAIEEVVAAEILAEAVVEAVDRAAEVAVAAEAIEAEESLEDERLEVAAEAAALDEAIEEVVEALVAEELVDEAVGDVEADEVAEELAAIALADELVRDERAEAIADGLTEPDVEALARRDNLLEPVTAKLGRSLKRALQDDQNELLNAIRQAPGQPVLDDVLPEGPQRERFEAATAERLADAFSAGASFLVEGDAHEGPAVTAPVPAAEVALDAARLLAAELAEDLTSQIRQRIERSLAEIGSSGEGAADAAGAAYREWKGGRIERIGADFATPAPSPPASSRCSPACPPTSGRSCAGWSRTRTRAARAPTATTTRLPGHRPPARNSRPATCSPRCTRAAAACSCPFGPRLSDNASAHGPTAADRAPAVEVGPAPPGRRRHRRDRGDRARDPRPGPRQLLHELPLVSVGPLHDGVAAHDRDQAGARRRLRGRDVHRDVGEPVARRPHRPEGVARLARARDRPSLPAPRRAPHLRASGPSSPSCSRCCSASAPPTSGRTGCCSSTARASG